MHVYNKDIADMQCWVFRMAQVKWKISAKECAAIFDFETGVWRESPEYLLALWNDTRSENQ